MRKGFTLIELIFAIVIIGVLAAVAVPQFSNLKQNAEASGAVKVAMDVYSSIPSTYVNKVDLEGGTVSGITDLVNVSGKGWSVSGDTATYDDNGGTGATAVAVLTLDRTNRNIKLEVDCGNFQDSTTNLKCGKIISSSTSPGSGETLDTNTSF
jgi:prepilin-type N-terminal cleavage/methylation domain-containing protein